jgi:hypothetical protein
MQKDKVELETRARDIETDYKEHIDVAKKDLKRSIELVKEDIDNCAIRIDNFTKERNSEGTMIERIVKLEIGTETVKEEIKKLKEK